MLDFTGMGTVLRALGFLYWVLAIGAIAFAIRKGKDKRSKMLWSAVAVAAFGFLPAKALIEQYRRNAYEKEAWAYFKKLCAEKSGEKIYKTYTGVKSVLVVKPLPPATDKDHFDQFWYGDPYSAPATSVRTEAAISTLVWANGPLSPAGRGPGLDFVELVDPGTDGLVVKYYFPQDARDHVKQTVDRAVSRFGISWEDISSPNDRKYWIAGSRFRVIDLADKSVAAERIGYFIESGFGSNDGQRRPWLTSRGPNTTCPEVHTYSDRWFLLKVLNPHVETSNGK